MSCRVVSCRGVSCRGVLRRVVVCRGVAWRGVALRGVSRHRVAYRGMVQCDAPYLMYDAVGVILPLHALSPAGSSRTGI